MWNFIRILAKRMIPAISKLKNAPKKIGGDLVDMMRIVRSWWTIITEDKGDFEVDIKLAANLLVQKGIAIHKENAIKIIEKARGGERKDTINYDEFLVIFCKPIFKDALINVAIEVERV